MFHKGAIINLEASALNHFTGLIILKQLIVELVLVSLLAAQVDFILKPQHP